MEVELLYKKIEGTLAPGEAKEVEEWLSASEHHREYFERLKTYYHETPDFVPSDDDLSGSRRRYSEFLKGKFRQKRLKRISAALLAASVALVAGVAFWFFEDLDSIGGESPEVTAKSEMPEKTVVADSVQIYTEKKTNGKVILSTGRGSHYGLAQISDHTVANVDYDEETSTVTYGAHIPSAPVETHRLSTAAGAELCLRLEDGTKIWLNSDTEIEYPNTFAGTVRRVSLRGEAYFEVSADSVRPFVVATGGVDVKVYGTQFNVNTRRNGMVATTLVKGSVALQPEGTDVETFLEPGETGEYSPATESLEIVEEDVDLFVGWRNGAYHFRDTSLKDLFEEISHWYDIEVEYADASIKEESFSGIISRTMPLAQFLNLLTQTNYVEFELKGKRVKVREKKNDES